MTNEQKAMDISDDWEGTHDSCVAEKAALQMAEWKDEQTRQAFQTQYNELNTKYQKQLSEGKVPDINLGLGLLVIETVYQQILPQAPQLQKDTR